MSINACIYDSRRNLVGCITDSVIERFNDEFETLRKRYFGDDVTPILGIMEKSLVKSKDKMSADFLNCLKLLSRKYRDDAPVGFSQDVSKAYHALVRHCCSQQVYDEVLSETIQQFRDAGLDLEGIANEQRIPINQMNLLGWMGFRSEFLKVANLKLTNKPVSYYER